MKLATRLALFATFAFGVFAEFPDHKIVLKTLQEAEFECKQYLRIPADVKGDCEPRCEGILLRSWTDCFGFQSVPYGRHYQPDHIDEDFLNRTQICLDTALEDVLEEEVCCQSSIAWQCYRDQYGNPREYPQLAPMPDILVRSTIEGCARILQINDLELSLYALTRFNVNDRSRRLLRCILIRQGLYSDASGPKLGRMYVQGGGYGIDEETFKQNTRKCIENVRQNCLDNSTLATQIANVCFAPGTGPGTIALINTLLPTAGFLIGSEQGLFRSLKTLDPLLKPLVPVLVGVPHALSPDIQRNLLDLQDDPIALAQFIAQLA